MLKIIHLPTLHKLHYLASPPSHPPRPSASNHNANPKVKANDNAVNYIIISNHNYLCSSRLLIMMLRCSI